MLMKIGTCSHDHASEILAIFNHEIAHSTSIYEHTLRTPLFMSGWFEAKERGGLPVLGAFDDDGSLAGFATYGPFRAFPAYGNTVEHSIYVRADRRGQGCGRALLGELVRTARARDLRVMVGVIDAANVASVELHRSAGFGHAGTLREVGYKFGRWLDVELYQLNLAMAERAPGRPVT
jgi:phosphinothricin acetyltransferase